MPEPPPRLCTVCGAADWEQVAMRRDVSGYWYTRWRCQDCGTLRTHWHSLAASRILDEQQREDDQRHEVQLP